MSKRKTTVEGLTCVHPQAAGFASRIGAAEIWAAIPPERGGETVRVFGTLRLRSGQAVHPGLAGARGLVGATGDRHRIGAMAYDQKQQERELAYLKKKAAKLGFTLTPHELALAAV